MRFRTRRSRSRIAALLVCCILLALAAFFGARTVMKLLYPVKYDDFVETYTQTSELEKSFVFAVIECESGFRPKAVSAVGARGLMQLMPETFEWLCSRTNEKHDSDALFDPAINIRYGCMLLEILIKEFGETQTAVAAYHAGIGNVAKWLQDPAYSDDGKTLHTIPFASTDTYVKKVFKTQRVYQKLYDIP